MISVRTAEVLMVFALGNMSFSVAQQASNPLPLQLTIRQVPLKPTFVASFYNPGNVALNLHLQQVYPGLLEVKEIEVSLTYSDGKTASLELHNRCAGSLNPLCGDGLASGPDWILKPGETRFIPIDLADYS